MRGFTIEMTFLAPVMMLLIVSSVLGIFYFHDKNIIAGAVYETAAAGGIKGREPGGVNEGELEALFHDRIEGKLIFFAGAEVSVSVGGKEIEITGRASGKGMAVSAYQCVPVTNPEKKIRDIRRMKGIGNGA